MSQPGRNDPPGCFFILGLCSQTSRLRMFPMRAIARTAHKRVTVNYTRRTGIELSGGLFSQRRTRSELLARQRGLGGQVILAFRRLGDLPGDGVGIHIGNFRLARAGGEGTLELHLDGFPFQHTADRIVQ